MRVRLLKIVGKRFGKDGSWSYTLVGYAELGIKSGTYGEEKPVPISTKAARALLGLMAFQPDDCLEFALPVTVVSPSTEKSFHDL